MRILYVALNIAQVQQAQSADPLINQGGEDTVYIGVGLLAITIILVLGIVNRRIEYAILFSVLLAIVLILIAVMT